MNIAVLIPAIIALALIYACWRYERSALVSPRIMAWLAAPAGFFIAFGIPQLLYAATGAAQGDKGMTVLLVADCIGVAVFVFEAFLAHRFHPIGTPFLCGVAGFALAVTVANWPHTSNYVSSLPGRAVHAMHKEIRHASHLHPATGQAAHQQYTYLLMFAIGLVVLYFFAKGAHRRRVAREGQNSQALPQPVLTRGLGVGSFFKKLNRITGKRGDKLGAGWDRSALPAGDGAPRGGRK